MAVPYSALLIATDVSSSAESAFDFDISDANTLAVVESLIQQVTGMMEGASGLNRNLIVRQYTHYFQYEDWDYDEARDVWLLRAPQWPVVEIDTAGFSIATSRHSFQNEADLITYTSRHSGSVVYYAGYRRTEQNLGNLTDGGSGEGSLSDLATLPPALPYDIRDVAINAVLMLLAERRFGPGQRTRVLNPAVQTTTVQEPILDYIRRMCRERIGHHRVLV